MKKDNNDKRSFQTSFDLNNVVYMRQETGAVSAEVVRAAFFM